MGRLAALKGGKESALYFEELLQQMLHGTVLLTALDTVWTFHLNSPSVAIEETAPSPLSILCSMSHKEILGCSLHYLIPALGFISIRDLQKLVQLQHKNIWLGKGKWDTEVQVANQWQSLNLLLSGYMATRKPCPAFTLNQKEDPNYCLKVATC